MTQESNHNEPSNFHTVQMILAKRQDKGQFNCWNTRAMLEHVSRTVELKLYTCLSVRSKLKASLANYNNIKLHNKRASPIYHENL